MNVDSIPDTPDRNRNAVVAVIVELGKYLVIRRSDYVRAPGLLCFPGGGIEPNEDMIQAIRREMMEELSLEILPGKHLWSSETRWGTKLEWIQCTRINSAIPTPSPSEVAEVHWMDLRELAARNDLLGSLPDFIKAIGRGEIILDDL